MRFIITGGGTGGHIYPALAIAKGVEQAFPGAEILYVGSDAGLEKDLAKRAGYAFAGISVAGLPRPISFKTIKSLMANVKGVNQAKKIVKEFQPDLVAGTGGYACGPLMLVAAKRKVPTLLHEQNAVMGVTNKILSKHVQKICLTFPLMDTEFPYRNKAVMTGLPVREDILQADKEIGCAFFGLDKQKPVVLVTGGSQGALRLNKSVSEIWENILNQGGQVLHIAGPKLYEDLKEAALAKGLVTLAKDGKTLQAQRPGFLLLPYVHEMAHALGAADIIIGRAGASFLAEVMAVGRCSILVPYPYATGNHQQANANVLAEGQAANIILDQALNPQTLWETLQPLLTDMELRNNMAVHARLLGKRTAVDEIIEEAKKIMNVPQL